jgi:hypothetical protein
MRKRTLLEWLLIVAALLLLFTGVMNLVSCSSTVEVISTEFNARALFDRYLWFKDAAAQLDKKIADISVYESKLKLLAEAYEGQRRSEWPRDDREQYAIWASELAGIKASFNSLAAEYNSAMAKINWRFAEVGMLPPGATQPLPREYKPYVTN